MRKFFLSILLFGTVVFPNLNSMEADEFAEKLEKLRIGNSKKVYNPSSLFEICAKKLSLDRFLEDFVSTVFRDFELSKSDVCLFNNIQCLWNLNKKIVIKHVLEKIPEAKEILKPMCVYEMCRPKNHAVISQDEKYFAIGLNDGFVNLYEMKSGKFLLSFKHDDRSNVLFISQCGNYLVSGLENQVNVWNLKTGEYLQALDHRGWVRAVVMSQCGQFVISGVSGAGHGNDSVKIWDWKSGKCLRSFEISGSGGLEDIAVSECGSYVLVSLCKMRVTDRQTRNVLIVLDHFSGKKLDSYPADVKWICSKNITEDCSVESVIFGNPHSIKILYRTWYERLSFEEFLLIIKLQVHLNKKEFIVLSQDWLKVFESLPEFLKSRFKELVSFLPI